ncbi:MAG: hypothetical protein ACLFWI_08190 [Coleofasciculus sp.]
MLSGGRVLELFVRKFPPGFGDAIAFGWETAIDYLENLRFTPSQLQELRETGILSQTSDRIWDVLANFRFEGDVCSHRLRRYRRPF